nr:Chain A, Alpha-crystallin B chain [Homo sapiens]
GDVIEV